MMLLSIFVNSIVEILGLAVVVPVIGLVVQPETIQTNPTLKSAFDVVAPLGIDTPSRFLIALCGLMIGAFLFKAVFGLLVNLFQTRFSFSVAHRLSGQMWSYHFSRSLEKLRGTQSGQILSEINFWPISFANVFLIGGLIILSELTIIVFIVFGLLAYNPIVFMGLGVLLGTGAFIIRKTTKNRLERYSQTHRTIEPQSNSHITNAIRGFLEVITFNASEAVRNAYLEKTKIIYHIQSNIYVFNLAPSKLYEVLAVGAVAGSIIIALTMGTPQTGFLDLLGFMAISAYRVMPSMNRVNTAIMRMRGQKHILHAMESPLMVGFSPRSTSKQVSTETSTFFDLSLSDITLAYETSESPILENFTHTFQAGRIHGIIGGSGTGKSTLVNALMGLHRPSCGSIWAQNKDKSCVIGKDLDLPRWVTNVGYLSQQPFLFQGTVKDNLTLKVPGATINENLLTALIQKLRLNDCLGPKPLEFMLQEGGSNLSGGQQQRLALLRALQVERPVLILDEATSALDIELRNVVFDLLRERAANGCNVILVTHDTELAQKCDDVLDLGTLTNGQPS